MKLSEMNTRELAKALCELTTPISRIAKDEAINGVFSSVAEKMKNEASMTMFEKMGMLLEIVPLLLEKHYADAIKVVSVMTGKSAAEVEAMNGMEMIDEMRGCIDSQLIGFFRSSAAMGKTKKAERE